MTKMGETTEPGPYLARFLHGTFRSVLHWDDLEPFWAALRGRAALGWYAYDLDGPPPAEPAAEAELSAFIETVDGVLRTQHRNRYCGLVYADDRDAPGYVIVYHPKRVAGCAIASQQPLPGWTLTLVPPVDLNAALRPPPRRGILRLLAGG